MTRWPAKPLLDVARLTRGTEPGTNAYTDPSRGIRFLRVGDVTGRSDNPIYTVSGELVMVGADDLLLAVDGSPGYVSTGHVGAISSHLRRVEVLRPDELSINWLRYALMSPTVQSVIQRHARGTTTLLGTPALKHIMVPIPPPADQGRLSSTLAGIESLVKLRIDAGSRSQQIVPAFLDQLLAESGSASTDRRYEELDSLCSDVVDCPHSTPQYAEATTAYPCLRSSDIQDGRIDLATAKYVEIHEYRARTTRFTPLPGDVVYCREGARLGNAAIIPEKMTACLGQRIMLLRPKPLVATGEFIWAVLNSPQIRRQVASKVGGSASPHINVQDVRTFKIPVLEYARQVQFAGQVREGHAVQTLQAGSLDRLQDLFRLALRNAFEGDL